MLWRQSLTDIQAECAVVSSQSTPLGRCGSLTPFTVTAKYDCHRNWDAACHIFNLHGREGSGDVEQREQYRHGPISAAILHLSTLPTPPPCVCYQLPTTRSPKKTTLMFSNTHLRSLELIYKLARKH